MDLDEGEWQQVESEPALCPCSKEGHQYSGLHKEESWEQAKVDNPLPLLTTAKATAGVLCAVLGHKSTRDGTTGEGSAKGQVDEHFP